MAKNRFAITALLVISAACAGGAPSPTSAPSPERKPPPPPPTSSTPKFADVDKLVNEQKLAEAVARLDTIVAEATKKHEDDRLGAALVQRATLKAALGEFETAIATLKSSTWPKAAVPSIAVELYYASALTQYIQAYSWEISQREQIKTTGALDLKHMSKGDLVAEAMRAYSRVWARREEVGAWKLGVLGTYIQPNNFPENIRGTLRDAISYLVVAQLADSALWSAQQSNELFRVGVDALLHEHRPLALDGDEHPMSKVAAVLDDLERFHASAGRKEAALEANLERLRRLHAAFTGKTERAQIEQALVTRLGNERQHPWWGVGQALRAAWVYERGDRLAAHTLAVEGATAFPGSTGAQMCAHWRDLVEEPELTMRAMAVDGLHRASITLASRNLSKAYFRAYAVDPTAHLANVRDYDLFADTDSVRRLLKQKPVASWTTELPPSPDYQDHATHVTPPLSKKGFYIIVGSVLPDFKEHANVVSAVEISISDLVLVTRDTPHGTVDARVFDGPSGKLLEGVDIELWRLDWQHGHHKLGTQRTDRDGHATITPGNDAFFLLARRGDELTFDPTVRYGGGREGAYRAQLGTLVYTDRSVYRPGQTIDWKVVVYKGQRDDGHYQVAPNTSVSVSLRDANYQEVQKLDVKTSAYGSANGTFTIPTGRLLGGWQIVSSANGVSQIRVEEYKRPTFEVTLQAPKQALALSQPAKLLGEARYYFGMPVTGGTARYTVTREAVYPYWWWWYYGGGGATGSQTVAQGKAPLNPDGTFEVAWKPDASTTEDHAVSYRYAISADVTDDGGETRSATRSYRLGFTTIEATIANEHGFFDAGKAGSLTVRRADLDGTPRPGTGTYRVVRIVEPAKAPLPAELPVLHAPGTPELTKADAQRSRLDATYDLHQMMAQWKDGNEVAHGSLTADAQGSSTLALPALPAGAYRARYETKDERGELAKTFSDFVVAGDTPVHAPAIFAIEQSVVHVGDKVRLLVSTALADQTVLLETFRDRDVIDRKVLTAPHGVIEVPIGEHERGGLAFAVTLVRDHQRIELSQTVQVPWDNQSLRLAFSTFRDRLRPGAHETFRVTVMSDGKHPERLAGGAELLAYMYDRSLDLFASHSPPQPLGLFPYRSSANGQSVTLGTAHEVGLYSELLRNVAAMPTLEPDRLVFVDGYPIGGLGERGYGSGGGGGSMRARMQPMMAVAAAPAPAQEAPAKSARRELKKASPESVDKDEASVEKESNAVSTPTAGKGKAAAATEVRSNFAETAFWKPSLVLDEKGEASFDFVVPDSVTAWNVWVHAITKDLRSGSVNKETHSVKDLMVRPYLPRFLREGDAADIEVVVNNAGTQKLDGTLTFGVEDPATHANRIGELSLTGSPTRSFSIEAGKSTHVSFAITAPKKIDTYAFVVRATAKTATEQLSDGELRPLPILPSRLHLTQSRFVTLRDTDKRTMHFDELKKGDDASLKSEQLVVTIDGQLFFTVLRALPYLVSYPYECVEQTLNRFVSTGIVTSLFNQYPQVAKMAEQMSRRTTRLQSWDAGDANRKMALEEAPFLAEAKGSDTDDPLIDVLDRRIASANRDSALDRLRKMQTASGAFPWFPGGPPDAYMTLYVLDGFSRAAEFKVDVDKAIVQRGWQYLARHYRDDYVRMMHDDCCWEYLAYLNYVAGAYPDESWTGGALTAAERQTILAFTFKHWKQMEPRIKSLLTLTLRRMGRLADAKLVWASVMDSAKTAQDQGTFWAPEDRSWLWYNDTIESHAFALRTLMEVDPTNPKKDGLVTWLLLNKKLNQWKSTRATAEVLYSLAKYMEADHSIGVREAATVDIGSRQQTVTFEPDRYVGKVQIMIPGSEVTQKMADITVGKQTKGTMFASATWSFATDKMPSEGHGDFFNVERRFYLRENDGKGFTLKPLAEGAQINVGDEIEVQLAISTKHAAEYVHLRDPRGAGFEPSSTASHWGYDLGLSYYEEVRDSGENFFFEALPVGQYTFKYRIRATTAGTFRVGPATLQSMYAPEFNAYSAGHVLKIAAAH